VAVTAVLVASVAPAGSGVRRMASTPSVVNEDREVGL
jgi:hypothetical protein